MDNFGFRYFDWELGRFITRDPSGYPDGPNNYLYCHNNPINFIDPLGLASVGKLSAKVLNKVDDAARKAKSGVRIINKKFRGQTVDIAEAINKGAKRQGKEFVENLKKKYPKLRFNKDGILDLHEWAEINVKLDRNAMAGANPADSALAVKQLKSEERLKELNGLDMDQLRWHHGPDGEMQLVPKDLHESVSHTGDAAFIRSEKKVVATAGAFVVGVFGSNTAEAIDKGEISNEQIANAATRDIIENVDPVGAVSVIRTYGEAGEILAGEAKNLGKALKNKNSAFNLRKKLLK